jgi:hypothetical protein
MAWHRAQHGQGGKLGLVDAGRGQGGKRKGAASPQWGRALPLPRAGAGATSGLDKT